MATGLACFAEPHPIGYQYDQGPAAAFRERLALVLSQTFALELYKEKADDNAYDCTIFLYDSASRETFYSTLSRIQRRWRPWWSSIPFTGLCRRWKESMKDAAELHQIAKVVVCTHHDYYACVEIESKLHSPHSLSQEILAVASELGTEMPRNERLPSRDAVLVGVGGYTGYWDLPR